MKNRLLQSLCMPLAAVTFFTAGPLPAAQAAMVTTEQVFQANTPADVSSARERLGGFLARDEVRKEMTGFGVDPDEAAQRVAALSDAEVARLAGTLQDQPAGGVIGVLLVILIVVAIVVLVQRA